MQYLKNIIIILMTILGLVVGTFNGYQFGIRKGNTFIEIGSFKYSIPYNTKAKYTFKPTGTCELAGFEIQYYNE